MNDRTRTTPHAGHPARDPIPDGDADGVWLGADAFVSPGWPACDAAVEAFATNGDADPSWQVI